MIVMFNMKIMKLFLMMVFITALATGCVKEYTFTPPASESGRVCTQTCNTTQSLCRQHAQEEANDQYQQCLSVSEVALRQCKHKALIEYNACLRYAENRESCHEDECEQDYCFNSANFDYCESDYRACFQNCGGVIAEKK